MKMKEYNNALFACTAFYVVYPQEENDIMSMWIQTKTESKNEILQVGFIFVDPFKSLSE